MEFLPLVALGLLTVKFFDVLRYAVNRDVNGVVSQLIVWVSAVGGLLLAAQTAWAPGIVIGGISLAHMSFWSIVFYGLSTGSFGSLVKDAYKAVDNNNTAKIPTLLPAGPAAAHRAPAVPGETVG